MERNRYNIILFLSLFFLTFSICLNAQKPKRYSFKIEQTLPHDVSAYTQGLFFHNGELYETTGQYGESSLRKVDLIKGTVIKRENFERKYFVEGSCVYKNRIYILTWRENRCFVYDIDTWKQLGYLYNSKEGWGLTTDGTTLIMSDGSSKLFFIDPETFVQKKEITVKLDGSPVTQLNELEYIKGEIWANVYGSDIILIISPDNGIVKSIIDCRNLLSGALVTPNTDVLNGIAWDEKTGSIYLTGKYWPKMYKISLVEKK
jgi:glutamine cyclotransferase